MAHTWEQLPDESSKAYAAFCGYRNLGLERTLIKAYEIYRDVEPGGRGSINAPPFFNRWSRDYRWVERSKAYDAHMEALRQEVLEDVAKQEARKWASRLETLREQEFEASQTLIERAQEMAEFPLIRTETKTMEDGVTQIVLVTPADWRPADVVAYLNAASKLARMAIGTQTDLTATREVETQTMVIGGREIRF